MSVLDSLFRELGISSSSRLGFSNSMSLLAEGRWTGPESTSRMFTALLNLQLLSDLEQAAELFAELESSRGTAGGRESGVLRRARTGGVGVGAGASAAGLLDVVDLHEPGDLLRQKWRSGPVILRALFWILSIFLCSSFCCYQFAVYFSSCII